MDKRIRRNIEKRLNDYFVFHYYSRNEYEVLATFNRTTCGLTRDDAVRQISSNPSFAPNVSVRPNMTGPFCDPSFQRSVMRIIDGTAQYFNDLNK